ncbi:hypothetical protein Pelo_18267 [Pelomyxa schiedti]|nr:hypothetical protein Pelo_18267 [Pelomyxa schiedti]
MRKTTHTKEDLQLKYFERGSVHSKTFGTRNYLFTCVPFIWDSFTSKLPCLFKHVNCEQHTPQTLKDLAKSTYSLGRLCAGIRH